MKNNGSNELQIDRMVDGELSTAQQRELLRACDADNRWRELALAYVESQVLGKALGDATFLAEDSHNRSEEKVDSSKAIVASDVAPDAASERSIEPQGMSPRTAEDASSIGSSYWNTWALAAAVLISLGTGYGLGWWWQGADPEMSINMAQDRSTNPNSSQLAQANPSQTNGKPELETMPFWVTDSSGGELRQVSLPLVNASDLGPNWHQELRQPDLPRELVEELRGRGVKLRQQRTMIRARRSDGRLVLVPIDYFYEELFQ